MKRVVVDCKEKKPSRAFDLLLDERGELFVEIKFPGLPHASKIRLNEHLKKLYNTECNNEND